MERAREGFLHLGIEEEDILKIRDIKKIRKFLSQ
jgi:hypothetical protein